MQTIELTERKIDMKKLVFAVIVLTIIFLMAGCTQDPISGTTPSVTGNTPTERTDPSGVVTAGNPASSDAAAAEDTEPVTASMPARDEADLRNCLTALMDEGDPAKDTEALEALQAFYGREFHVVRLPNVLYGYKDDNIEFYSREIFGADKSENLILASLHLKSVMKENYFEVSEYPTIYDWFVVNDTLYIIDRSDARTILAIIADRDNADEVKEEVNQRLGFSITKCLDMGDYAGYRDSDVFYDHAKRRIYTFGDKAMDYDFQEAVDEGYFRIFTSADSGEQVMVYEGVKNQTHDQNHVENNE